MMQCPNCGSGTHVEVIDQQVEDGVRIIDEYVCSKCCHNWQMHYRFEKQLELKP